MNRLFKIIIMASVAIISFVSCNDDDTMVVAKYWAAYGEVVGQDRDFYIKVDNGAILHPSAASNNFVVEGGERVWALYTLLDSPAPNEYVVHLHALVDILTKDPVLSSSLDTQEKVDSIGNDPINVIGAGFSAQKYLNIEFEVLSQAYTYKKHFLNLVVMEDESTDDQVVVEFRHNAEGIGEQVWKTGTVSFDITSLVPQGKESVKVVLRWTNYQGQTQEDSGTFSIGSGNITSGINGIKFDKKNNNSENNYIEIQ